jgi:hypothetical protein
MPSINTQATADALTGNGDADGYVTITSNAAYYPGAFVWMRSGGATTPTRYIVTDLSGATKVGLREVLASDDNAKTGPQYGRTPVTQWTVANSARIFQEECTVRVDWSNYAKVPFVGHY